MKKSNSNTKAQIFRSAFYLLLLLAICAMPFALAKRSFGGLTTSATPSKQTEDPSASRSVSLISAQSKKFTGGIAFGRKRASGA